MGLLDIFRISQIKEENERLKSDNATLQAKINSLGVNEYYETKQKIEELEHEASTSLEKTNSDIASNNTIIFNLRQEISELEEKNSKLQKSVASQERKVSKCKELYKSIDYAINNFFNLDIPYSNCKLSTKDFDDLELISPSVTLKLHCMDVKSLRKAYKENEKQISKLLDQYSSRYTTKANKSIYNLMVIALRAEIQNILYNLKYEKLEKSIELFRRNT